MDKESSGSIAKELKELKKLLEEGVLTEAEFQIAKKRLLGEDHKDTQQEKSLEKGLKRNATAYDVFIPIIVIISILSLGKGLLEGIILGSILGVVSYLVSKITLNVGGRIALLVIFAIVITFLGSLLTTSNKVEKSPVDNTSNHESVMQKITDETALKQVYDAISKYGSCRGDKESSYKEVSDCIIQSNLPVIKFSGTSCDESLNKVVDAVIEAKDHCQKAGFYEDGKYIKSGISIETYTDEVTKCSAAIDQFYAYPYSCGSANLLNLISE